MNKPIAEPTILAADPQERDERDEQDWDEEEEDYRVEALRANTKRKSFAKPGLYDPFF